MIKKKIYTVTGQKSGQYRKKVFQIQEKYVDFRRLFSSAKWISFPQNNDLGSDRLKKL